MRDPCTARHDSTWAKRHATSRHVTSQVTLAVGVVFQLLYLYHYDLWSAFVPLVGELVLILYLTGLKLYFHDGDNAPGEGKISTPYTNGVTNGAVDDKGAAEEGEIKYQSVRDQRRSSRNGGGVVGESGAGQVR